MRPSFSLTAATAALFLVLVSIPQAPAQADGGDSCFHNGEEHADGTRVGERVCRDGQWVEE